MPNWQANAFIWSFGAPKVHFVSIQTVPEMHLFVSRIGKQMHSNGHLEPKNAFREHSNCTRNAFVSESDWQANAFKWSFGAKKCIREHSNCTRNAFVAESDWQANAFKWSFGSTKVHFVSIQTVPKMHLLLSGIGKQCIQMLIWSTKKCVS